MQHFKVTKKNSEIDILSENSEKLTSSLACVMNKFQLKRHFAIFDCVKSKGLAVSSLLSILVILPFLGFASIHSLVKTGLCKIDFVSKKDALYDIKNNPVINWRKLLFLHVKRFIYLINHNVNLKSTEKTALIFDDTILEKTGKKIEKSGYVHNHTSNGAVFILGFKLLVCGFWDGKSFIPIDFSLHREKGNKTKRTKLINAFKQAKKTAGKQAVSVQRAHSKLHKQCKRIIAKTSKLQNKTNKTNKKAYEHCKKRYEIIKLEVAKAEALLTDKLSEVETAKKKIKRFYNTTKLYGLSKKEREQQYKKVVEPGSPGATRRKEANDDKINIMLKMLCRAVKNGIIPDYVLIDSWFFCFELLDKLAQLKNGSIKLISMVKINNQIFTLCTTDKQMSVKNILSINKRKPTDCKKMKSKYIKVKCKYKGIRVNLFFVKMGKSKNWHLLITTDLSLTFIQLMELYQIRWSIEVFFKETKQYLNLGGCQSNCFDAQIADITLSMIQYIMLIFFKRVNYQQSISGLFKDISDELVMLDLVTRLLEIFWELLEFLCEYTGVNFLELQRDAMRDEEFLSKFITLFPEKVLKKAA